MWRMTEMYNVMIEWGDIVAITCMNFILRVDPTVRSVSSRVSWKRSMAPVKLACTFCSKGVFVSHFKPVQATRSRCHQPEKLTWRKCLIRTLKRKSTAKHSERMVWSWSNPGMTSGPNSRKVGPASDGIEKTRKSLEYGAQLACRMFIISMIEEIFWGLAYVNTASNGEA